MEGMDRGSGAGVVSPRMATGAESAVRLPARHSRQPECALPQRGAGPVAASATWWHAGRLRVCQA